MLQGREGSEGCEGCAGDAGACGGDSDVKPLKVEVQFQQRLARKIDRGPSVERAVTERAGEAVDHHDRVVEADLGLARQRSSQNAGHVEHEVDRNILPRQRRRRHRRMDLEFDRMRAGVRAAADLDGSVATDRRIGVDAVDAAVHSVVSIGKLNGAIGHRHMVDGESIRVVLAGRRRGFGGWRGLRLAPAQQRDVSDRPDEREFGDVRMSRPQAPRRHVGLDAINRQPVAVVAVVRVPQRDIVQRHVQRRPDADPGRARYRQPVSGFALDPGLDRLRHEPGRNPDHQQQRGDGDHGGDSGPGDFQCSHDDVPNRAGRIDFSRSASSRRRSLMPVPERETAPGSLKVIQGYCKVM